VLIVNDPANSNASWCERLYEANARQLLLYGRALGLSHSEAEDVLQETFMALLRREAPPEQPHHYCLRSYRNRALNYRRSVWRRVLRELESARWFERSASETALERAAMRRLAELPVEQREAIVLKVWHQYTFEEIGGLLGISPNTAAGRYRYGLQKLRATLEGEEYEELEPSGTPITFLDTAQPLGKA
jgi:RNA polymerase sigma-70 factor (ECF subfamily)